MIIAAILVIFMVIANALSDAVSSRTAGEIMGMEIRDVCMTFNKNLTTDEIDDVLETVRKYAAIHRRYFSNGTYLAVNGEELYCCIDLYPEDIITTKGRAPIYENEIVITEMVAEELELKIGDSVDVAKNDNHKDFIVCGIYQSLNDTGRATAISGDAGVSLGLHKRTFLGAIALDDETKAKEIKDVLEKEYGDTMSVSLGVFDDNDDLYKDAVSIMRIIIYSFSMFFALVVVSMVSSKTFTQEKTDIGIYKSQGFTTGKLRLQFAIRFFIVSVLGAFLGLAAGSLFLNKLLSVLLRGIGITNFYTPLSPASIIIPAAAISVCFLVFSFFASRKIKKVGIRQLITE